MVTTRRAISWAAVIGGMALTATACGGGGGDSTVERPAPAAPAKAAASAADPCALVPLAEWESVTTLSGLRLERDGAKTCDILDDANARVAGSVQLLDPSVLPTTRRMFKTVDVNGVGDEAFWVAGMIHVRHGDQAFSIMVNGLAVGKNREAAERLARVALTKR